ncbi:MAG: hypothetical protein CMA31_07295 [Euryarchaeota archaeon]|nr:hypothetical protein [Euryarchaeota archaeon]
MNWFPCKMRSVHESKKGGGEINATVKSVSFGTLCGVDSRERGIRHRPYMDESEKSDPVIQLNEVFPGDTNALNTLFGGRLMSIMDTAAGMAASKFCSEDVVTISVDALKFKRPAYQGDIIRTIARVVWTSPRTIGVHVTSCRLSRKEWNPEEICSGFFFMVAVDGSMKPTEVPQFIPNGEEESRLYHMAMQARDGMRSEDS